VEGGKVNNTEVERYFGEYILPPRGFIYNDIKREIDLAYEGRGGGNFLSALGLLCYTEFMGAIYLGGRSCTSKEYFTTFLRYMGTPYQQLLDQGANIYKVFRCGMAHTYFPQDCAIAMLDNGQPAGIVINNNGRYFFIVEKYFRDFMNACQQLYNQMVTREQTPWLPST
jgi:hypothetical protein